MPAQQLEIHLGKRKLVIDPEARLELVIGKEFARALF